MDGRCSQKLKLPRKFMLNYQGKSKDLSYFLFYRTEKGFNSFVS